jgi:hypothetical protein
MFKSILIATALISLNACSGGDSNPIPCSPERLSTALNPTPNDSGTVEQPTDASAPTDAAKANLALSCSGEVKGATYTYTISINPDSKDKTIAFSINGDKTQTIMKLTDANYIHAIVSLNNSGNTYTAEYEGNEPGKVDITEVREQSTYHWIMPTTDCNQ